MNGIEVTQSTRNVKTDKSACAGPTDAGTLDSEKER
jgi:hypothetical protein